MFKPLECLGSSRRDLRSFPVEVRSQAGYELYLVQQGLEPRNWKSMPNIGTGVREIRIRVGRDFRIIYIANFPDAVYVLHVFEKKSQRITQKDLDIARQRFTALRQMYRER